MHTGIEPSCNRKLLLGWFSGSRKAKKGASVSELTRILQSVEQGDASRYRGGDYQAHLDRAVQDDIELAQHVPLQR